MENAINTLRIQNFKSIKDATINPRRVNLLIGQPNVGKSNILEAMSLLGAGLYEREKIFMGDVLRYETISNLFYDSDISMPITIKSDISRAGLYPGMGGNTEYRFQGATKSFYQEYAAAQQEQAEIDGGGFPNLSANGDQAILLTRSDLLKDVREHIIINKIPFFFTEVQVQNNGEVHNFRSDYFEGKLLPKKYVYHSRQPHEQIYQHAFLRPPLGHNLWEVVQRSPELRREIAALFKSYGLSLVLRVGERKFEIQKQVEDLVYNYPYSLIADTLQRIIFYLAAIESNDDSVLLLEEPETHQFPVYTSMLGRKIVESKNNQFFIATHSPYLVTEILEQMVPYDNQLGELAIFLAYYEDYQTKIKQLSDEEIRDIRNDGIDIFYNLSRFTPGNNLYA